MQGAGGSGSARAVARAAAEDRLLDGAGAVEEMLLIEADDCPDSCPLALPAPRELALLNTGLGKRREIENSPRSPAAPPPVKEALKLIELAPPPPPPPAQPKWPPVSPQLVVIAPTDKLIPPRATEVADP